MRILIAEDDPVSRRLLEAKLVKWGYDVAVTRDGNEAWQALQADDSPRLAILDWMMPDMEGGDVAAEIQSDPTLKQVPVVFLTAIVSKKEAGKDGLESGGHLFIAKPVDLASLVKCIEENT